MGKSRRSTGGSAGGNEPQVDYTEQNNEVFKEICDERGVGPKTQKKLKEILEFCNENNLELSKGITIESPEMDNPWYSYGGTARATIIDRETGKRISIFDDILKGKYSDELSKDSLDNLLKALRYQNEHTNQSFNNLYSDILLTNHRLIQDKDTGKWRPNHSLAFFDPIVPNAITVQTSMLGKQHHAKLGENSYGGVWDDVSVKNMADVIAHETGHAYDFHVIGKGKRTDMSSIFTEHGFNSGTTGPCDYATDYMGETISTVCEMVNTHRVRDDATLSTGKTVDDAYYEKYGGYPHLSEVGTGGTVDKRMYEIWSNDPVWKPLIAEAERIMF